MLADDVGHEVDVHSCMFDAEGNNVFGVPYPAESLTGSGTIAGHLVDCISPAWMVKFHSGYELDMDDYLDVTVLCTRFRIELPAEYRKFQES